MQDASERDDEIKIPPLISFIPKFSSCCAVAVGLLVLFGWQTDMDALKRVSSGFLPMDATTAVAFLLAGACLAASLRSDNHGWLLSVARILAAAVLLIGCAKLTFFILGTPFVVDEFLYVESADQPPVPTRMSLHSGINLSLVGIALMLIDRRRQPAFFSQLFAVLAACTPFFALLGYVYGAHELFGPASLIPLPIHGAAAFVVIAVGIFFARPEVAWARMFSTNDPAGALARRLFPAVLALTLIFGWFAVEGERRGFYETSVGTALLALLLVVIFSMLIRWTSGRLERGRSDTQLTLLKQTSRLQDSLREVEMILNHTPEMIWVLDPDGRVLTMNAASDRVVGMHSRSWAGRLFHELHDSAQRELITTALQRAMAGFSTPATSLQLKRHDQTAIPIEWTFLWSAQNQRTVCVGREGRIESDVPVPARFP